MESAKKGAKKRLKKYKSELKELKRKREEIKEAMAALEKELGITPKAKKKGKKPVVAKSPAKSTAKRGGPTKVLNGAPVKMRRQRALNGFDHCIINALKEKGKIMINSELMAALSQYSEKGGLGMNEDQVRVKLNQTLQKLANRRGLLVKAVYSGKGYAYGLQEWLNRRGNIATEHRR